MKENRRQLAKYRDRGPRGVIEKGALKNMQQIYKFTLGYKQITCCPTMFILNMKENTHCFSCKHPHQKWLIMDLVHFYKALQEHFLPAAIRLLHGVIILNRSNKS